MGVINWLRDLVGVTVLEEEYEDELKEVETEDIKPEPQLFRRVNPEERGITGYSKSEEDHKPEAMLPEKMAIEIFSPQNINDCRKMADRLKAGCPVIINVEYTKTEDARHIYFFMRGCCYALNGSHQKLGNNIFMFSPGNIGVAGIGKNISLDKTFSFTWSPKA